MIAACLRCRSTQCLTITTRMRGNPGRFGGRSTLWNRRKNRMIRMKRMNQMNRKNRKNRKNQMNRTNHLNQTNQTNRMNRKNHTNQTNHKTHKLTPTTLPLFGSNSTVATPPRSPKSSPSSPSLCRALATPTIATESTFSVRASFHFDAKRISGGRPPGSPNSSPSLRSRGFRTPCSIRTACRSITTLISRCVRCFRRKNWRLRK